MGAISKQHWWPLDHEDILCKIFRGRRVTDAGAEMPPPILFEYYWLGLSGLSHGRQMQGDLRLWGYRIRSSR